jgi:hypothetical protein
MEKSNIKQIKATKTDTPIIIHRQHRTVYKRELDHCVNLENYCSKQ